MVFGKSKKRNNAAAQQSQAAPPYQQMQAPPQYAQTAPSQASGAQSASQASRQMARESDRQVMRAQRDMQRERIRLEAEEKKIMSEIKALSRQGRVPEARMLAKNLVQVRNAKARTFQAGIQMSAIGNQTKMAQANSAMMNVMGQATSVMQNANVLSDPQKQMNIVQEFDMQSEKYKLTQEMTDEVLDSALGGSEIDGETDDVLNSVLDEIGLEVANSGTAAPEIRPQQVHIPQHQAAQPVDDSDLMERIARLG